MKNIALYIVILFSTSSCAHDAAPNSTLKQNYSIPVESDITVEPSNSTLLGRAARDLSILTRGKILYSPKFLLDNPQAAASFRRQKNTLYIDKITFENPNTSSVVLNHEMLHARVFSELTRRAPAPWYVSFKGASFGTSELFLDESLAYRRDLAENSAFLAKFLSQSVSTPFDNATISKIRDHVTRRFAGEPPKNSSMISEPASAVDGVAKKLLHGSWHSEPALTILKKLSKDTTLCSDAVFNEEFGVTVAKVDSISDKETIVSQIFVPESGGLGDPRNCLLLQKQVSNAQKFAEESSNIFKDGKDELIHILAYPDASVKMELLTFAQKLASQPLPHAELSLRRAVLKHTSNTDSEILRKRSLPVSALTPELFSLLASLRATVTAENGVGIAAPQIGINQRVILVKRIDRETNPNFVAYINPEITEHSVETALDWEGCLSIPDGMGQVRRFHSIHLRALNERGEWVNEKLEGFVARIFQHEIDHLNGTLFIDKKEPGELRSRDQVRQLRQGK